MTMYVRVLGFLFLVGILACIVDTRQLTRCQIVSALTQNGFKKEKIPSWVCLIIEGSNARTDFLSDDGKLHGIFQISSDEWCYKDVSDKPDRKCHIKCSKLRDNSIADDAECAKVIIKEKGFGNWKSWKQNCKGKNLNAYVRDCEL